ncbi:hypothetical protein AB4084_21865, partial [Lysobacter sp. 2RAB21]
MLSRTAPRLDTSTLPARPLSLAALAAGLALGALSHYRFIAVIAVGFVALMLLPEGRRALRDVRV